ncbi:LysM peptidoglycan-binding domain-containing protein [Amycolatopsis sp. SID8362]|uniref:LysM peptidoglycan-binding domain-containing protein n=1 Tax=Amycolatopsis sp. SID8362 TaxID=2690346 RepID=UPI0013695A72|nr:LysM peptidoglycan-binding domain-containing protein [Amycolatopsis sp. SID8362]NBH02877.1 LysM peptidoglycan-binding domain-containing protein [Amycolatopsis sp. SID8362]NED39578.1 LysM peptidoglycan-binding domain-containing protein [Amycolatopsis sp. SID8362]
MRTFRLLVAAVVLLAITVVPPVALWHVRSAYLPDRVPSATEAVAWLTGEDNGRLFLLLLVAAGLIAWLQLVVAIVLELLARLRGAAVPRLPGFGWAQRIAAALLLVVLTGTAAEAAEPTGDDAQPTHVVAPGDSLMKIAAGELGSSARYREVFDLNRGIPQPGGRSLQNPGLLRPGWILRLPQESDCEEVVVRPGQTLSQIASEELGDAGRYREIFGLNRGRPQLAGRVLDDPDSIRPGDVLRIPRPAKPAGGGGAATATFVRASATCQTPEPPPPTPPSQPTKPPPPPPSVPSPVDSGHPSSSADADDGSSVMVVSVGGVLAVGLLTLLAARRRRAHQRRRPGHRIRHKQPGRLEKDLRAAACPGTVDDLDRALRTLARHAGADLPRLRAVKIGTDGITLRLAEARSPIAPFVQIRPAEWQLDPAAALDGEHVPPPYPALVSLGHTADRDLVLINLHEAGVLALGGDRDRAESVILAMAWDLAAAPWAAWTQLTLVGTGRTSAERHPDRLRFASGWDEAFEPPSGRPQVLLSAVPPTDDVARRLPPSGYDAVVTALDDDLSLPEAWHLDATGQFTTVKILGEDVELQRLSPEQVSELVAALADADEPDQVQADEYRNVPPEEIGVPEAVHVPEPAVPVDPRPVATAMPSLQLLGPVRLHGADPEAVEGKKLNRLTELAAYLALHPGVTADDISRQLGTDTQPWSAATRQGYISRLRTWLGRDENGQLYVPNVDARSGGYRMSGTFTTDWHEFQDLARRGLADRDRVVSDLRQALDLVQGTPFSNAPPGRYAWSSWLQREMIDAIVDVAHTLADAYQKAGDLPAARRAAMRGLLAEPVSEILYRDLLRIEYRAGNLAAVRETADKLVALTASLDVELDQETSVLVSQLLARG